MTIASTLARPYQSGETRPAPESVSLPGLSSAALHTIAAAAETAAATHALPLWRNLGDGDVTTKSGEDPVTVANHAVEHALMADLSALMRRGDIPAGRIIGEEAVYADPRLLDSLAGPGTHYIIDPIDGTRPFVRGEGGWGVMIALINDGVPVAGWLHDPVRRLTLIGVADGARVESFLRLSGQPGRNRQPLPRAGVPRHFVVSDGYLPRPETHDLRRDARNQGLLEHAEETPQAAIWGAFQVALGELAFWSCTVTQPCFCTQPT